jgi:DNA end-binding protein Ku
MPARAIASTTVSFGLVSLPVKLYSTGEPGTRISFNLLHEACGTRLKQQYVCPTCDVIVPRDDMAKGYEFSKNQYVLFNEDELKAIEAPKTDGIEITEFVPEAEVEPVYLDKSYYLGPDKGGARAYRLLSAALRDAGRVAIAKYATRGRQHLVMIRPHKEGLLLDQLRYAGEVRSFDEVPMDAAEVKPAELTLARQLIDQSSADAFEPERYTDEVREQMLALIQRKVEGEEISVQPSSEDVAPKVIDLMAALKASLEEKERMPAGRAGRKEPSAGKKGGAKKAAAGAGADGAAPRKATGSRKKKAAGG